MRVRREVAEKGKRQKGTVIWKKKVVVGWSCGDQTSLCKEGDICSGKITFLMLHSFLKPVINILGILRKMRLMLLGTLWRSDTGTSASQWDGPVDPRTGRWVQPWHPTSLMDGEAVAGHGCVSDFLKRCRLRNFHLLTCRDFNCMFNKYSYHNHYQRDVIDISFFSSRVPEVLCQHYENGFSFRKWILRGQWVSHLWATGEVLLAACGWVRTRPSNLASFQLSSSNMAHTSFFSLRKKTKPPRISNIPWSTRFVLCFKFKDSEQGWISSLLSIFLFLSSPPCSSLNPRSSRFPGTTTTKPSTARQAWNELQQLLGGGGWGWDGTQPSRQQGLNLPYNQRDLHPIYCLLFYMASVSPWNDCVVPHLGGPPL